MKKIMTADWKSSRMNISNHVNFDFSERKNERDLMAIPACAVFNAPQSLQPSPHIITCLLI